jgi:hypothetical protein
LIVEHPSGRVLHGAAAVIGQRVGEFVGVVAGL